MVPTPQEHVHTGTEVAVFSAVGARPDPVAFLCAGVVFELGTVVQLVLAWRKFAYTTNGKYQAVILTWLSLEDRADVCLHNNWKISDCHAYTAFIGR